MCGGGGPGRAEREPGVGGAGGVLVPRSPALGVYLCIQGLDSRLACRIEDADLPGPRCATMAPEMALIQLCISSGLSACT